MLNIGVTITNQGTPYLARVSARMKDKTPLNKAMAGTLETVTAAHIRTAAASRHATAQRLGATPTQYLSKQASGVEAQGDATGVTITVPGRIFRRVLGPVQVVAKKKWLTIPAAAESYGKRAREMGKLRFVKSRKKPDSARLVNTSGTVLFWLKKKVTLPQDRELLPSNEKYAAAAELAAREFIKAG
jgi:hypothetical protein